VETLTLTMSLIPHTYNHWIHYWPPMVYAAQFNFPLESRITLTVQLTIFLLIYLHLIKFHCTSLYPIINGLSDHAAQSIILEQNLYFYFNKKFDTFLIVDFNTELSYESWEDIFNENKETLSLTIF